jgi:Ser/Thr protein kinase RdoA (MazF antagonist)
MRPYLSLTPRGQARRLRPLAWQALKRYDLEVARLSLVTNDLNGIFRIDTRDGQKYILRVSLPEGGHTRDHIAAEMDWLAALDRDTDLHVPRPIPARDGAFVVEAGAPGVPQPRLCAVFTWVPGVDLDKHLTRQNVSKLGELMAGLHDHALTYRPPAGLSLQHFDRVFPFTEPVILFEERYSNFFPPQRRLVFEKAVLWVQDAIDRLKACREPMRIMHCDLHQWNVRIYRGKLYPIDFEDLMLGWPVQDIASTLYYFFPLENYQSLRDAFEQGYTRRSSWPERYPGEIDAFIAGQGLILSNFILEDPNPDWRTQAAEFIGRVEQRLRILIQER